MKQEQEDRIKQQQRLELKKNKNMYIQKLMEKLRIVEEKID